MRSKISAVFTSRARTPYVVNDVGLSNRGHRTPPDKGQIPLPRLPRNFPVTRVEEVGDLSVGSRRRREQINGDVIVAHLSRRHGEVGTVEFGLANVCVCATETLPLQLAYYLLGL